MTTKDKLQFALELGRHTKATVRQVQALMRYAKALDQREELHVVNMQVDGKRQRIVRKICDICASLSGPGYVVPLFAGDPRNRDGGLKIRVPSGEEIVCPS